MKLGLFQAEGTKKGLSRIPCIGAGSGWIIKLNSGKLPPSSKNSQKEFLDIQRNRDIFGFSLQKSVIFLSAETVSFGQIVIYILFTPFHGVSLND